MGRQVLFWIKKADANIETGDWNRFLDILLVFLIIAIAIGVAVSLARYSKAVKNFRIHSADDVFRDFTPGGALAWALVAGIAMAVLGIGYYSLAFRSFRGSFALDGIYLAAIAAVLAVVIAVVIVKTSPSMTPRQFRYRKLIGG